MGILALICRPGTMNPEYDETADSLEPILTYLPLYAFQPKKESERIDLIVK